MAGIATAMMVGGAAKSALGGLTSIASGIIGSGKRKAEQREAQRQFNKRMSEFENLDTSNLYRNMDNTYEDLTVNQQQADYTRRQQEQGLANVMGGMQGAAGGSGIAALAQSLAGQASKNAERSAVSIGQQESRNQMLSSQQQARNNVMEIQGQEKSRALQREKTETLLGMSQQRLGAANAARQQATQAIVGGVGGVMGAGADAIGDMNAAKGQGANPAMTALF
jgi:hypothetical protein